MDLYFFIKRHWTYVSSPLGIQVKKLLELVVLPSQSSHHNGKELLPGSLNLWCEAVSHLGGDYDGQAVRQKLLKKGGKIIKCSFTLIHSHAFSRFGMKNY